MDIRVLASGSTGNCSRVSDGTTPLLLEAGIPIQQIRTLLSFTTHEIQGCLVSHYHQDHAKAVKDLVKAGVDCYMTKETLDHLDIWSHRTHVIKPLEQFSIGSWSILAFPVQHDAEGAVGYLIGNGQEKLLYLADTAYSHYTFKGLTHIMVECNYESDALEENLKDRVIENSVRNRVVTSHFSLENVKDFLRANDLSQVQEIHLLHLSKENADPDRFKREIQELTGKVVYIP